MTMMMVAASSKSNPTTVGKMRQRGVHVALVALLITSVCQEALSFAPGALISLRQSPPSSSPSPYSRRRRTAEVGINGWTTGGSSDRRRKRGGGVGVVVVISASSSAIESPNSDGDNNTKERTLYEILEVPQSASPEQLRRNYLRLAKLTHPDAAEGEASSFHVVAEAWNVLSDPKERLKYDRTLQAKKIAEGVGELFAFGFKTAVPLFKQTVNTTIAAAEVASQVYKETERSMTEAQERMKKANEATELRRSQRELEQRAEKEAERARELKAQIKIDRSHTSLGSNQSLDLTAAKARQIIRSFKYLQKDKDSAGGTLMNTHVPAVIEALEEVEFTHRDRIFDQQTKGRELRSAKSQVEAARLAEVRAKEKLEQAKRDLEMAQQTVKQSVQTAEERKREERDAVNALDKALLTLESQREKTRMALRKTEDENLRMEDEHLRKESDRLERLARELREQAEKRRDKAEAIQRALKETAN